MNLICDLDGVVYLGSEPVSGSAQALELAVAEGWNVVLCTNNSSRTPADVASRVASITGFSIAESQVVTSAQAAASLLAGSRPLTLVLGGEGIRQALFDSEVPLTQRATEAEAVVVGLAMDLTYAWLREAVTAVRRGARLIATNLDPTYPTEEGPWPGGGAIVAAVETAAEVKAEAAGKPWPPMRALIEERLIPGPVWVVGDRADTDVALAAAAGWRSALVMSGVTSSAEDIAPPPDLVAGDLATVVRHLIGRSSPDNHPEAGDVDSR